MIPYACKKAFGADDGKACELHANIGTMFAILAGSGLSSLAAQVLRKHLLVPCLLYILVFALFCAAACFGGFWAHPVERWEGNYVVFLVCGLRMLGPLISTLRLRLIQTEYDQHDWEDMNLFFFGFSVAANWAGVSVATYVLA